MKSDVLPLVTFANLQGMRQHRSSKTLTRNTEDSLANTVELDKVLQDCRAEKLTVELGDTVDLAATDDGQVRHAHVLGVPFFDERHARKPVAVAWELLLDGYAQIIREAAFCAQECGRTYPARTAYIASASQVNIHSNQFVVK